jgi:hypothetical protein
MLGARRAADGADGVAVVAVVAGGVGLGLIQQIGTGVHRGHVAVDLRQHHIEPPVLGIRAAVLKLGGLEMTGHAADALGQRDLVDRLLDRVVAADAGLLAVHAVLEALAIDIDVDHGAVVALGGLLVLVVVTLEAARVRDRGKIQRLGEGRRLFGRRRIRPAFYRSPPRRVRRREQQAE